MPCVGDTELRAFQGLQDGSNRHKSQMDFCIRSASQMIKIEKKKKKSKSWNLFIFHLLVTCILLVLKRQKFRISKINCFMITNIIIKHSLSILSTNSNFLLNFMLQFLMLNSCLNLFHKNISDGLWAIIWEAI